MSAVTSDRVRDTKREYATPELVTYGDILQLTNILVFGGVNDTIITKT